MSIYKMGKIFLALLLAGSLSTAAWAEGTRIVNPSGTTYSTDPITGTFSGFSDQNAADADKEGGAIHNKGTITSIGTGDEIEIEITKNENDGTVTVTVVSPSSTSFTNNKTTGGMKEGEPDPDKDVTGGKGGAIFNEGNIGTIDGVYFGENESRRGGAIYNGAVEIETDTYAEGTGTIDTIKGSYFVQNKGDLYAGAIYNSHCGVITNIENCYFLYNESDGGNGGAVENAWSDSTIVCITGCYFEGNFTNRNLTSANDTGEGGAIYNEGTIGTLEVEDVTGDTIVTGGILNSQFVGNSAYEGGAIYNKGTISIISDSLFKENTSTYEGTGSGGGAIFNREDSIIGDIEKCIFINNTASGYGAAIYNFNRGSIGNISDCYFEQNTTDKQSGGAIYNQGTISEITNCTFVKNGTYNRGGAIENLESYASLNKITGCYFEGNYSEKSAGAISNYDTTTIELISNSCFVQNTADMYGGAICNEWSATIESISECSFFENQALCGTGGAINNSWGDTFIGNITKSYFEGNIAIYDQDYEDSDPESYFGATGQGGAIYNEGRIGVDDQGEITGGISDSQFVSNKAGANGGAIYNRGSLGDITRCYFEGNTAGASGGAIYNANETNSHTYDSYTGTIYAITNSSFVNNTAADKGGAIYTASDLTIVADGSQTGGDIVFKGNSASEGDAIFMAKDKDGNVTTLSFSLSDGGSISLYDSVSGDDGYGVNISGDGTFYLYNDLEGATLTIGSEIKPLSDTDSGTLLLSTVNDEIHTYNVKSFTLADDFDMYADVDFEKEVMDHFETTADSDNYTMTEGKNLNVSGLNGISDTDADRVAIYFAESGLMKNVTSSAGTVYAPIYTYDVDYVYKDDEGIHYEDTTYNTEDSALLSSSDNGGYFVFNNSGFNPAVMGTSIAEAGAYNAFGMVFDYNFEHSDYYMKLPEDVRLAMSEERKQAKKAPKENDPTRNAYYNQHELTYRGAWTRSFFSNESVDYGSGWNSRDKYYGAMLGFDTDMKFHDNGWANVTTGYVGTMGIRQQFSGGHIKQHGGFVGITESFYKKNFYTAWTIAAGSMKAHEHTMYGHDKDRIDDYGIAARFGWNIKLDDEGKYTLLPTFTASYSYIHPEDFVNAAGTNINGSGVRAVQLNPNVKFIWKMNDGWQPYLTLGEIWTVGESSHIRADSVKLPELDLKAYTEYGIGVQKRWANERDAYIQLLGHSDGRDGILVNAGIRWNF